VLSQWEGVRPKRYQQHLTLDHATWLLAERHSVLDTAYMSGLSGICDSFITWRALLR
jgi:AraC family transcriptional regulator of adaptative response/methylated-DNA-[protein]-cysteine methyltransferase